MTGELILVAGAYLLGSIPSSLIVVRLATGADVRTVGSRNVGTTNAVRAAGMWVGVLVGVIDALKGVIAAFAMQAYNPASRWLGAVAVAVVVGHCFPVWLRFRGGKGVLTAAGAFLVLAPAATLVAIGVALIVLAARRIVSLASLTGAAALPICLHLVAHAHPHLIAAGVVVALIIIGRHTGNLRRLAAGVEPRMGEKHPKDGGSR